MQQPRGTQERGLARSAIAQTIAAQYVTGRRGFTVVELLVVVAVIALLMGLLIPALRAIKTSSRQGVEMSAARQLMTAYIAYAAVHNDAVLPGYHDSPRAFDAQNLPIAGGALETARRRYLWRLAPYFNYNLRGLYLNENAELLERLEQEERTEYLYIASLVPSLGLNTEWMGGDASMSLAFLPPGHPMYEVLDLHRFYVRSMAQVLRPNELIVFASARSRGNDPTVPSQIVEGYFKVTSPYLSELSGYRWADDFHPNDEPSQFGYLSLRYDNRAVCAFVDGHTDSLTATQLKDMQHWANWATSPDWRIPRINQDQD